MAVGWGSESARWGFRCAKRRAGARGLYFDGEGVGCGLGLSEFATSWDRASSLRRSSLEGSVRMGLWREGLLAWPRALAAPGRFLGRGVDEEGDDDEVGACCGGWP